MTFLVQFGINKHFEKFAYAYLFQIAPKVIWLPILIFFKGHMVMATINVKYQDILIFLTCQSWIFKPHNMWKPGTFKDWPRWRKIELSFPNKSMPTWMCRVAHVLPLPFKEDEAVTAQPQPLTSDYNEGMNWDNPPAVEFHGQVGCTLLIGIVVVVRLIIASGIFIPTKGFCLFSNRQIVGMSLVFWAECSTLVLLGSLCAMIPKSGAVCVYGPGAVSFYGWMLTLIVRPYSLSVVARSFVHYVDMSFFPDWEISPIPARKTVEATCLGEYHVLKVTFRRKKT